MRRPDYRAPLRQDLLVLLLLTAAAAILADAVMVLLGVGGVR